MFGDGALQSVCNYLLESSMKMAATHMTDGKSKLRQWISQVVAILIIPMSLSSADIILPPELHRMAPIADPKSPAARAVESAQAAIRQRDLETARKSLEILATDPDSVHPEILLAELLGIAGLGADARNILDEFSGKEPTRIDLNLAYCEIAVRENRWFDGWVLANSGETATVPDHWSPAFRQHVANRLKTLKAICCEGRKDWKGAHELYTSLSKVEKPAAEVIAGLGRSSFHLGDADAALSHFELLRKLKPDTQPPQMLLAQLYDITGKTAEAEAAYRKAIETAKADEVAPVRLAFARRLIQQNQAKETAALLKESIKDSPENETERNFLQALVARMEGRTADAQKMLSPLHQQNPATFVISNQLALVLCQNPDESLRARAMQIAEGNVRNLQRSSEAWATLGWVQLQLGDPASAEKSLANAAQLGPLSRDTVYYLWQLKKAEGDAKAAELLQKAFAETAGPDFFSAAAP